MADLTFERIAELRACHDKVRSFHGTHDLGGLAAAMHEWSRQLQMSSEALLAAAERGLTGDRKAAALDALDAMLASGRVILKRPIYNRDLRIVDYSGSRILVYHVDNLMDGIEQIDKHLKEPTDAK